MTYQSDYLVESEGEGHTECVGGVVDMRHHGLLVALHDGFIQTLFVRYPPHTCSAVCRGN